jgi:hypothetical protein
MVMTCAEPGCSTLTLGRLCIAHEPKVAQVFVRGRPWPPVKPLTAVAAVLPTTARMLEPLQPASLVDT